MKVIEKIMVPVDYSPASAAALIYAANLAKQLGASLDVVHVWETEPHVPADAQIANKDGKLQSLQEVVHQEALRSMAEYLARVDLGGVELTSSVLSGPVVQNLTQRAEQGIDLIVIGTHGRSGFQRFLLGSVAEKVARAAPIPVLIVRGSQVEQA